MLLLSKALALSPAMNAQAIPLVQSGATPPPGTALSVSGYGLESGAEGSEPNGRLYSTTLVALGSDPCRGAVGVNSAVLLCAISTSSSTCRGDSGGPLTEGSPAVQVGIVDFGGHGCPVNRPDGFTNLAAPEVRAFVEGDESPPVAARPALPPLIRSVGAAPVDFSPLTCEPGAWSGSPSFTYTFQVEDASPQVLQSGPSNVYTPPSSLVGVPLVCIVQASNPGGVTTVRSGHEPSHRGGHSPPRLLDGRPEVPPAGLQPVDRGQRPQLRGPGRPVPGQLQGHRQVPRQEENARRAGRTARRSAYTRTVTLPVPVSNVSPGGYRATATGLPYNKRITFTTFVTNAAGLRSLKPPVRSATLHRPSKKSKPKSKHPKH